MISELWNQVLALCHRFLKLTARAIALIFAITFASIFVSQNAVASRLGLLIGPAGLGIGDPNPITFVSPAEYEVQYVTASNLEFRFALTELYAGHRETFKFGGYLGIGGGVFLNANGIGLGVYSAFGYDIFCFGLCFSAEYLHTFGLNSKGLASPYALRIGASYVFN